MTTIESTEMKHFYCPTCKQPMRLTNTGTYVCVWCRARKESQVYKPPVDTEDFKRLLGELDDKEK